MFCPKCGKAEQVPESYCRQCGFYLPDLSRIVKRELPPEDHLKANTVLSALTIITSFTLSILLFAMLGFRSSTHPLIYATAGVLLGIGGWHIQTLIRTQLLKKQWKRRAPLTEVQDSLRETQPTRKSSPTAPLLNEADFENSVPVSVTENTTRHLSERPHRK
jgi:hypothetical protein